MLYHSTRSEAHFVDSAEAVLEGLAGLKEGQTEDGDTAINKIRSKYGI